MVSNYEFDVPINKYKQSLGRSPEKSSTQANFFPNGNQANSSRGLDQIDSIHKSNEDGSNASFNEEMNNTSNQVFAISAMPTSGSTETKNH